MKALLRNGVAALGTTMAAGLVVSFGGPASAAGDDAAYAKREDNAKEWVVSADDDLDDDTNTGTKTGGGGDTSKSNDNTGSRASGVSRDRDNSRGDNSRDWTRDGGDRTRDHSGNHTNDRSRNDTR